MSRCPEVYTPTNARCTLEDGHEGPHMRNEFVKITDREREYLEALRATDKPLRASLWHAKLMRKKGLTSDERRVFDRLVNEFHTPEES